MLMNTDHGLGMLDMRMVRDGMGRGDGAVSRDRWIRGISTL